MYVIRLRRLLVEVYKIYHEHGPMYLSVVLESPENVRHGRNDRWLIQS